LPPFFVRNFHRVYRYGTFAPLLQRQRCWYSKPESRCKHLLLLTVRRKANIISSR
jgi:hypothetical protein